MEDIAGNIAVVQRRIAHACDLAGRNPDTVRLLPVTKNFGTDAVLAVYRAGYRRIGENKVQEALDKWEALHNTLPDLGWAIIGHLQTNKARTVARIADEFQALDSLRLAQTLDRHLRAEGRQLDVLIQVNSSGEDSKYGLAPEQVVGFARQLAACTSLRPKGFMTLALPYTGDEAPVAACFERMLQVQRQVRETVAGSWDELSMGMSGDLELAIAHGATCVRVGTAIFGRRENSVSTPA